MSNLTLKQKVIGVVIFLGLLLIAVFQRGFSVENAAVNQVQEDSSEIRMVSSNPPQLKDKKEVVVAPSQVIEFTFSEALENVPETKIEVEPVSDIKLELSEDRKTVKIIPVKPYSLGQGYTIFIRGNTKFEGKREYGKNEDFHFSTISYRGE